MFFKSLKLVFSAESEIHREQALYWFRRLTNTQMMDFDSNLYVGNDSFDPTRLFEKIDFNKIRNWVMEQFSDRPKYLTVARERIFSDPPLSLSELGINWL